MKIVANRDFSGTPRGRHRHDDALASHWRGRPFRTVLTAAMAAGMTFMASARTMTMTVNRTQEEVSSFDFAFENIGAATTNSLYVAFGTADGGTTDFSGWTSVAFVAEVPGDTTALMGVLPPAGWDDGVTCLRFFLLNEIDLKGAQRVEYIEATGTQYIMTDFTPTGKTHVEADIQFTELTTSFFGIFCARGQTTQKGDFTLGGFPNQNLWQYEYEKERRWPSQKPGTSRHSIGFDYNGLVVDGTLIGNTTGSTSYKDFTANGTMSLFACHNNGANWDKLAKMKLWRFKAWADLDDTAAAPVLDLLPCTTNGVACLYNRTSGTFLGNIGTGEFVAGPAVSGPAGEIEATSELVATGRKTLGLWTFDGASGENVVGDRTTTITFSNHVARADALRLDLVWPDNTASDTPLPTYTNDVQYAYLFNGLDCTNLVQTCGSSIQIRHKNWNSATVSGNASYNRPHAFLMLKDAGALIKGRDWTLEVVARLDDRSGGSNWCPMLELGTNTGNRVCFVWRTQNGAGLVNNYATSSTGANGQTITTAYPKYDDKLPSGNSFFAVRPSDGNWHHIAWKWSETDRTLSFYVDYGLAASVNYWNSNGANLELDDHAAFTLFPSSKTSCNHLPTIQAVRLTRGDLAVRDFLCTSRFPSLPETAGHWRYEGTPGETNCLFVLETQMPNRTDLRLWKHRSDYSLPYVAPWKRYVKLGSDYVVNQSGVCGSTNETAASSADAVRARRCYMSCMQQNPWWTLPGADGSFTYEAFLRLDGKTIRAGSEGDYRAVVFAEKDGPGGMKDSAAANIRWMALNWGLCQDDAADDAPGALMTLSTWEAPDGNDAGNGRQRSDVGFYVSTNNWHHVAVTYDAPARTMKIYVDRRLATDIDGNGVSVTMSEGYHLTRGASMVAPGENNALNWRGGLSGAVDEFRVTRRALSPKEFLCASSGPGTVLTVR